MNIRLVQVSINKRLVVLLVFLVSALTIEDWARVLLGQAQPAPSLYSPQDPIYNRFPQLTPPVQPSSGQYTPGNMYPTGNQWPTQPSAPAYNPCNPPSACGYVSPSASSYNPYTSTTSASGYVYPPATSYNSYTFSTSASGYVYPPATSYYPYNGISYSYGGLQPPVWQGYPVIGSTGVINYYSDGLGRIAHWSSLSPGEVDLAKIETRSALNNYSPPPFSVTSSSSANPWAQSSTPMYYNPGESGSYSSASIQLREIKAYASTHENFKQSLNSQPISDYQENLRLSLRQSRNPSLVSTITTDSMLNQTGKLANAGFEYLSSGQIEKALDSLNQALILSQVAGHSIAQATIQSGMAHSYLSIGDARQALDHFDSAYLASRVADDPIIQVSSLRGKAVANLALGESDQALESLNRARSLLKETNDTSTLGEIDASMGWIYQSKGEFKKALEHYQEALLLTAGSDDHGSEIRTRIGVGLLYSSLGEPQKAVEEYRKALAVAETKNQKAEVLASAGELYQSVDMTAKAADCFDLAISLMKEAGNKAGEAGALASLARTHLSSGRLGRALYENSEALRLMKEEGNRLGNAAAQSGIGDVYFWGALNAYPDLKPVPPSQQENSYSFSQRLMPAKKKMQSTYLDLALTHYQEALLIMRAMDNRAGEFGILTSIGSVYDFRGKPEVALDYFHKAIEVLESMRTAANLEEFKAGLLQQSIDVYRIAFSLHIRLGQYSEAFDLSERARARALLDQLGNARIDIGSGQDAELTSEERQFRQALNALERRLREERAKPAPEYKSELIQAIESRLIIRRREYEGLLTRLKVSNPGYASLVSVDTLTLPKAQKLLNKDVTLISYFVTPKSTIAFVLTRDSFYTGVLPVSEDQLASAIASFRDFPQLEQSNPPILKQLYKCLIAPIKPHLKTPLIGIIPHGILHYLPFAALIDGNEYLGDKYTLFHFPSVSVLPFIKQKPEGGGEKLLAMAYGRGKGLPFLRYADREAQAVAGIYNAQALFGDSASKQAFRAKAAEYNILHLVAHYQPNYTNPLFSHLTLAPGEANDGALEVREIYGMDLRKTDLVVLSACQSRLGAQSRGDDIIGLERAFMYAGATTLIASLWSVDDQATSELITLFFKHLKEGMTKADALRLAQAETRAKHPHPYYWAGFVLTGLPG